MTKPSHMQPTLWQFFILFLCAYVLIALLAETVFCISCPDHLLAQHHRHHRLSGLHCRFFLQPGHCPFQTGIP